MKFYHLPKEKYSKETFRFEINRGGGLEVALAFSNSYSFAISSLGWQWNYFLMNKVANVERFYYDPNFTKYYSMETELFGPLVTIFEYDDKDWNIRFVDLPGFGYAKVSKDLKSIWQKNLVEFIKHRVSIRVFIHLRDARHPNAQIDKDVQKYVSQFIRGDQLYLNVFTKIDKLNQKERNALKREYPNSITLSNLKRNGYDRVHQKIFEHIFGISHGQIS
jgi:hypothetical protein